VILVLQLEHRGLVLGRKIRFLDGATYLLRRYHGYVLAYLAVQQLWFHPWVATSAHAVGLAHSVLLLAQSSLIHTKMHLNPYWCLLLEAFILLHALPLRESPYGYLAFCIRRLPTSYATHALPERVVCVLKLFFQGLCIRTSYATYAYVPHTLRMHTSQVPRHLSAVLWHH
jgi:hypothetical protein